MAPALHIALEPNRMEILRLVWTAERSAGDIVAHFKTTFGAVSQHLGRLFRAGLLHRRREGRQIYYQANRVALGPLAIALEAMWAQQLGTLKTLAEAEQRRITSVRRRRAARSVKRRRTGNTSPRENDR